MSVDILQPTNDAKLFPESFGTINTVNIERRLKSKLPDLSEIDIKDLIIEYKKFLLLFSLYGNTDRVLAPGYLVDEVWHEHILHSKQYYDDCMNVFNGTILHHYPSMKEEGESLSDTYELYEKTFSQKPPEKFWLNRLSAGTDAPCCGNGGGGTTGCRGCRGGTCSPGR